MYKNMEKKYNRLSAHQESQHLWDQDSVYEKNLIENEGELYTIDTPPPTISGTLHIGHIFSYTHTDIIARYKRMKGYRVFYPFGFDNNGLPTERFVEKKRNVRASLLQQSEFEKICTEESELAIEKFKCLWKKLGISADFKRTYTTISSKVQALSQRSFLELFEKKLVYRDFEPAIYCISCQTSVSQAEIDDSTKETVFYTFEFCKDPITKKPLCISTTRPELLSSCVGLVFHPNDKRYIHLNSKSVTVPLYDYPVLCIADELVDPKKGTGLVMICTFGDKTDIEWYKKYKLPYRNSIGFDGKMTEGIGKNLSISDARTITIEQLRKLNCITEEKKITHSVGMHERCKNSIEYLCFSQWFVSIMPYKKDLLNIANSISWHPAFMKSRLIDWIENLQWDWCISRQRPYGIRFPVWHCLTCQTIITAEKNQLPCNPTNKQDQICPQCKGTNIIADTDVMDTWNTSSLSPYIIYDLYCQIINKTMPEWNNIKQDSFFPLSMRPQAHDIIRTWAFDTIVKLQAHQNNKPWNNIVISGHVLSDKKEKISKSMNNEQQTPERLLTDFDPDAVRYWTAQGSLGQDCNFSIEQIQQGKRLITKLWNACVFIAPHINDTCHNAPTSSLSPINQWVIHSFNEMSRLYHQNLDFYETGHAITMLDRFFWNDYCDNYIEIIKNILFNPELYPKNEYNQTIWTLYQIGFGIIQHYAPFLPYLTETIYQRLYRLPHNQHSIHQTRIIERFLVITDAREIAHGSQIIQLAKIVRKLKSSENLSLKTPLKDLVIYTEQSDSKKMIAQHANLIKGFTQTAEINFSKTIFDQHQIIQSEKNISINLNLEVI